MGRQDEGNSADGGFGGNPSERFSRNRDTSNWTGAPPSTAPAAKPPNRNQPPAPPASPESVAIEQVSRSSDLQFKLADLYARENFSDGAPFDETYIVLNQRELAKAFLEKHKKELAQLYLAHHYAKESGLDLAYVDQYPEQLAQNYIMGHALELARGYVTEHRVQLAEEFLASNQMDLAQSFVEEHQLDLAQRYVSEYTDRLVTLMDSKRAQSALAKLRQATPAQGAVQAAVQPAAQPAVPVAQPAPPDIYAPPAQAAGVAPSTNDVLADLPTMAILTKKTAEYSTMSPGQSVTEEMPISNYRPMPRLRPRRRTTTTQLPVMNPGQAQPAASAQQPAVLPAAPVQPTVPAQVAQTQQLPLYQTSQSSYQSVQASNSGGELPADGLNQTGSYASQSSSSSASSPPAAPLESYAPPATAESTSGANAPANFQTADSEPYLQVSAAASQSSESSYIGHDAPTSPLAQEPILPDTEQPEPRRLQSNAPPPLSGDYTNDARNAVLWDQLGQVPLSTDGSVYAASPPVSSGSGFNSLTPPAWESAGFAYQGVARADGAVPLGMEDFMSTLSESAISAQANPAKGLARFGSPPPSLRSDGAAAEVTSAWF